MPLPALQLQRKINCWAPYLWRIHIPSSKINTHAGDIPSQVKTQSTHECSENGILDQKSALLEVMILSLSFSSREDRANPNTPHCTPLARRRRFALLECQLPRLAIVGRRGRMTAVERKSGGVYTENRPCTCLVHSFKGVTKFTQLQLRKSHDFKGSCIAIAPLCDGAIKRKIIDSDQNDVKR